MAGAVPLNPVGAFYLKFPHEDSSGPVFIRKLLEHYHVCVQHREDPHLYEIVADTRDPGIADVVKDYCLARERS